MSGRERRFSPGPVEVRSAGGQLRIGGYAAVFGATSRPLPPALVAGYEGPRPRQPFTEDVQRGAFNESRAQGWPGVVCRQEHDPTGLLGTIGAGTLRLSVDSRGLEYEVDLPPSRRDVLELVERGDIPGSSFSFAVIRPGLDDTWTESRSGLRRSLRSVHLVDVAPVAEPAYRETTAARRSLDGLGMLSGAAALAHLDRLQLLEARSVRWGEERSALSADERDQLPDDAFAYIEPGGTKDSTGRTLPRSKRHYPIHDAAHVRAALARIGQGAAFADLARPAVHEAAHRLGIATSDDSDSDSAAARSYAARVLMRPALQTAGAMANFQRNATGAAKQLRANGKAAEVLTRDSWA